MATSFSGELATGPTRAEVSKIKATCGALGLLVWCLVMPILFYSGHFLRVPGHRRLLLAFHHGVKRLFNIYTEYEVPDCCSAVLLGKAIDALVD